MSLLNSHPIHGSNKVCLRSISGTVNDDQTLLQPSQPSHLSQPSHPSHLSQPHLNSTSHVYHKLHTLKRHQKSPSIVTKENERESTHHTSSELGANDFVDLEGIITHRPLKVSEREKGSDLHLLYVARALE